MLVDDHELFLQGLQYLLETNDIEVVAIAKSGKEAFKKIEYCKPDIILLDINMPDWTGHEVLNWIKTNFSKTKIVMLTSSEDQEDLHKAIQCGASGYFLKNACCEDLVDALKVIYKGGIVMPKGIQKSKSHLVGERQKKHSQETDQLTERQLEILRKVSEGMSYKKVGMALGISERTVKYHMGRISDTLEITNKAEAISYMIRLEAEKKL